MNYQNPYMITFQNATEAFEQLYDEILNNGVFTENDTIALYNVCFTISNPVDRIITTPWRKFKPEYAELEWNWYLSGWPYVTEIKKHAKIWDNMHNGDDRVNSNYGYQWMRNDQLNKCIEQLKQNPNTRQAWISLFDGKEKDDYKYDTPCTIGIGFRIQNNKLHMTVIMRSNDLVFGFGVDQYCFSKLQELVAKEVGVEIGTYTHFASDLHIYKRHWDMKKKFENK